jgi:YD repeat-containing protein
MRTSRAILLIFIFAALPIFADQHKNQLKGFNPENIYYTHDIDSINAFNGNLTMTIPIGQEYPMAEGFSYRLTLYSNSSVWDSMVVDPPSPPLLNGAGHMRSNASGLCEPNNGVTVALPNRRANAGLGWTLSLGRLYEPGDVSRGGSPDFMYESPDGSEHPFRPKLHPADPEIAGVQYTTDSTYIRMHVDGVSRILEFPDGSKHTFKRLPTGGGPWLPVMLEHLGSDASVSIEYPQNTDGTYNWRIHDTHGREQLVHFAKKFWDGAYKALVTSVDLAAFPQTCPNNATGPATYTFNYKQKKIGRTDWHEKCDGFDNAAIVQLLESVVLPDDPSADDEGESRYSFEYNESENFVTYAGLPRYVVLPTGGVIEWEWEQWAKPVDSADSGQLFFSNSWGVGKRYTRPSVGSSSGQLWDYSVVFEGDLLPNDPLPRGMKSVVVDPEHNATASYFSVATRDDGDGWRANDYGKPFSRNHESAPGSGEFLSLEQYSTFVPDFKLRSTYVTYETDDSIANPRVVATRVVNGDDLVGSGASAVAQWTDTINSQFDGFGHYRHSVVTSSSAFMPSQRTTHTDYNASGAMIAPDKPWILGTYTSTETSDGTATSRSEYCFDETTGRLKGVRAVRGSTANDLLTVFEDADADGNVEKEQFYGGDDANYAPSASNCDGGANPQYTVNHTYAAGVLKTSTSAGVTFPNVDLDIDPSTGFPRTSRDTSGVATTYQYNPAGQLRAVRPKGAAWTEYQYKVNRTPAAYEAHGTVIARQWPEQQNAICNAPAGSPLTEERYYYDELGRFIQQRRRMPNLDTAEQWSVTEVEYDDAGRKVRTSVATASDSGAYSAIPDAPSTRVVYDALGRVTDTILPDGSSSTTHYKGTRQIFRSATIATPDNPAKTVWNKEEYDALGRLRGVTENANYPELASDSATTTYKYDEGNRLVEVQNFNQTRTFSYDGAGLLTDETQPELAKSWYTYDARAHLRSKTVNATNDVASAAVALQYAYDPAERLLSVTDAKANHPLKVLTYDATSNGRLATQTRHNYFSDNTWKVTDTFAYDAATGRLQTKTTDITRTDVATGTQSTQQFTSQFDYTELGEPDHLKYPTCSTCGGVATNERNLALSWKDGLLTGIDKVTPATTTAPFAISYTPAGAVARVQHAKIGGLPGVLDTFEPDPNGMARVHAIRFDSALTPVCQPATAATNNQTTLFNTPAHLIVTAGGTEPRHYQWYRGLLPDTTAPVGGDAAFFDTPALTADADYWVKVTNACGTANGPIHVTTTACPLPALNAPDRSVLEQSAAHLTVSVTNATPGDTLHYQWYHGAVDTLTEPVGTDKDFFDTPLLTAPTNYWVKVTNSCGTSPAVIHVTVISCSTPYAIQAVPAVVVQGMPFQLLAPPADNTTYRWYRTVGTARTPLGTTTSPASSITVNGGISETTSYSVEMESTCTSTSSELVMIPCIRKRVVSAVEENDAYSVFVVDDQPGVTFQWYEGASYSDLSKPLGTGSRISVQPVNDTYYWVRMTHVCNNVTTVLDSNISLLSLHCLPRILVQPVSATQASQTGNVASATVVASSQETFTYQWCEYPSGTPISGDSAQTATYSWQRPTPLPGETGRSKVVYVIVRKKNALNAVISVPVTLAFSDTPQQISASSGNVILNDPHHVANLFVTMDPPAVTGEHEYQYDWYIDNGTPEGEKIGSLSAGQTFPISGNDVYWVVIKGVFRKGTAFEYHQETVSPKMIAGLSTACALAPLHLQQTATEFCSGGDSPSSQVTFRASNETPNVHFQWYTGQSGDTREPIAGATAPELTIDANPVQKVWVRAWLDCGAKADSATLFFSRDACRPLIINQNVPPVVAEWGSTVQLVFGALSIPNISYQWYMEGPPEVGLAANDSTLVLNNVQKSARYYVQVRDTTCANSAATTLPTLVRIGTAPGMTPPNWVTEVWRDSDSTTGTALSALTGGAERYEWFRGEVPDDHDRVSDSTLPTFTTPPLTADTHYWVRVHGSGTKFLDSPTITVKICNPPRLTNAQVSQLDLDHDVLPNQKTVFYLPITEPANGTQFTYTWLSGATPETATQLGETTRRLEVAQWQTTHYWCRVTSACGIGGSDVRVYTSPAFTAHVCVTPTIDTPAATPARIAAGTSASLHVAVTTTFDRPPTYQWYVGATGDTTHPVAGATSATASVSPAYDTTYWVRVTVGVCPIDSATVTVSLCTYPQTVTLPANINIASGETATIQFPQLYPGDVKLIKWYRGVVGDRATLMQYANAPALAYTTTPLTTSQQYWMDFEHLGCITTSSQVSVNVCRPTITGISTGTTVASGTTVPLSVTTSSIPGQSFQWYTGTPGNTSNAIAGKTTASITVAPTVTTSYWVRVTGTCTPAAWADSAAVTITTCNAPVINSVSPTQYASSGQQSLLLVSATGTNLTYQWYVGASGNTSTAISGQTNASMYVHPTTTTTYWCRVTGDAVCASNSASMTVNVCTAPVITQQPTAVPVRIFTGAASQLSVTATSGGSMTYQWYAGTPGVTTAPVAGGTTASINVSPTADTTYWVRITTSVCSVDSAAVTVSMCTYNSSVTLPATIDIVSGATATIPFPTLYPGDVKTIRWYRGAAGDHSNLVAGGNVPAMSYTTPALTATTQYWMEFDHNGCITTSNATTVRVCKPTITTQPQSAVILSGTSRTLSVSTTGSPLTYQWYIGSSGVTTQPISGATGATLTVTPPATTTYWLRATGCATNADSAAATLTVCTAATVTTPTKTTNHTIGSTGTLTVTAGGTSPTFQWYKGQSGDTSQPISGATSASYSFTLQTSQYFWVRATSACNNASADSTAVLYSVDPHITTHPADVTISRGTSTTLSVVATGTYLSYQWYSGQNAIAGATSATYATPALTTGTPEYWCIVSSGTAGVNSAHAFVTLCDGPTILSFTSAHPSGSTYVLTVNIPSSQFSLVTYYWYTGVPGNPSQSTLLGADNYSTSYSVTSTTTYWVRVRFNDGSCYSDTAGKTLP